MSLYVLFVSLICVNDVKKIIWLFFLIKIVMLCYIEREVIMIYKRDVRNILGWLFRCIVKYVGFFFVFIVGNIENIV